MPSSAYDNMQMLLGDSVLLVYLTSVSLFNTHYLGVFIFCAGPLIIFFNGKTALDIVTWSNDPYKRSNFVRLISTQDSQLLMILFTLLVQGDALICAYYENTAHLLNLIYAPMLLYMIFRLEGIQQKNLRNSLFPAIAVVFTIAGIYLQLNAHILASQHAIV